MADGTTEIAEAGATEAASGGMPQLDFSTFANQIFWLVVTLVIIYLILSRVALPRIGAVLAERSGTITNDIAAAEDFKNKAHAAEAAYDKALADARSEANRIIGVAKDEIKVELDAELRRADAEIAARTVEAETALMDIRDQSVASVTSVARDTARAVIEALGGAVEAATVDAAVDARMKG